MKNWFHKSLAENSKKNALAFLYFLAPFFLLFLAWEAASRLQLINPILFPPPTKVFPRLGILLFSETTAGQSVLLTHVYYSLYRLLLGFVGGAFVGVFLGILMGMNKYVHAYFNPIVSLLMPVPGITWAPILILWLGFGDSTIIPVILIAAFFPIVLNTIAGVKSISKELIWASQTMGANKKTIFWKVLLPGSAAYIFNGLKLGLAHCWRTLIAVEMLAASLWGLGYMIFDAREYLQTDVIYAGIIVLGAVFLAIEKTIVRFAEKRTVEKWGVLAEI